MTYDLEQRVHWVVADILGIDTHDVSPDVSLADDLAADSLDLLDLATSIEAEFAISLSDATLERMRTCRDLTEAVTNLVRTRRMAAGWAPELIVVPAHHPSPRGGLFGPEHATTIR
jgi:acyl carrier protein